MTSRPTISWTWCTTTPNRGWTSSRCTAASPGPPCRCSKNGSPGWSPGAAPSSPPGCAVIGRENPLYEHYDQLLEIAREYDVTLSLGDGLRPGCLADATDKAQLHELKVLGELTKRAWAKGVQVMVEGPGHLPLHAIQKNVRLQQKYCANAPFYVLGPLVTDVASGYDHIAGAIGGALAATLGASFLCYVTPAEHLKLPEVEDVIDGVVASRIAAHAADIARGLPGAADWDLAMSKARRALDWDTQIKLSINPAKARRYRELSQAKEDQCTMCGRFCAMKVFDDKFEG